ncbi:nudix hydrolase-like protein [Medicago truncatula]|uniref:Nudix hydrolase-like protein n=1 Tax=Medicago truncatula TaxID=3880 RepID=A0A072V3G7_MEDTR|nr:nudix hydrolase-like protein [Medicago truncatula]
MSSNGSQRLQTLLHHLKSPSNTNPLKETSIYKQNKRAAVLICLFEGQDGNLRVILTQRASSLSTHAGEVALPGGKRDESDADDIETALREAKEEIGLDPSLVTVVTLLEPFHTKNDNRRSEEREWLGEKHLVHYFDYEVENKKYVIWAITAAILIRAATLLLQRPPAFLEQRPKIWGGITENDMIILQRSNPQL